MTKKLPTKKIVLMKKIIIRPCRSSDYRFINDLSRRNMETYTKECWGRWDSKKFKSNLKKENIKIINYGKKKIGFFDITRHNKLSYLHNLQITSFFQGKGLGTKIMAIIEQGEKAAVSQKINAKVFKKNPATLFYRQLGYKTVKRDAHSLILEKTL